MVWSKLQIDGFLTLLRTGELPSNMIEYYLAYTTQIYDFASKYEWNSILQFDYQYRERQAEHGFTWGSLTANMELQLLQQRIPRSSDGGSNTGNVYKSHKDRSENLRRPSQPCCLIKPEMEIAHLAMTVNTFMFNPLPTQQTMR